MNHVIKRRIATMAADTASWESSLLRRAYHALDNHTLNEPVQSDQKQLQRAYAYCADLTRRYSHTFYLASGLLPPSQRQAARALYAFCRISDNLVDEGGADRLRQLRQWRQESLLAHPHPHNRVALAWADTRARYGIPRQYAEQLLDGVAADIMQTRYQTFRELAHYCYGVASTVGLMTMHIVGYAGEAAIPYAIKLGVALQLTNILRDVGEDWQNGRFYLPLEELATFNLTEDDIATGQIDGRWHAFMHFQISRTRQLYREALPGVALLESGGRFAIAAAAELYRAILNDIEAHSHDVFNRRANVSDVQKLKRLPGIWWRSR
jgi:phytoene synthase